MIVPLEMRTKQCNGRVWGCPRKGRAILVLGRDVPEHVRKVDSPFKRRGGAEQARICLDEGLGSGAKVLHTAMKEAEVIGNAHRSIGLPEPLGLKLASW